MSNDQQEDAGGEYVEILNVCIGRYSTRGVSSFTPLRSRLPTLSEIDETEKENLFTRGIIPRTSLYGRKAEGDFNPSKPLSNPYRTSDHDQMPVRVLPLAPLDPKTVPRAYQPIRCSMYQAQGSPDESMPPRTRAASVDDLLLTSQREGCVTRSLSQRSNDSDVNHSSESSTNRRAPVPGYSQTWCRNKAIRQKKNATKKGFHIFSRSSKRKSRSEFKLNRATNFTEEPKEQKPAMHHGHSENFLDCCNNNVTTAKGECGKDLAHTGKLSNFKTRLQRRFHLRGKKEKPQIPDPTVIANKQMMETETDSGRNRQSPRKRKSTEHCDMICEDEIPENNNHTHNLLTVLRNKEMCEEFRSFLANEHSDENLDFWTLCEKFKTTNDKQILAGIIFKQFLDDGAPREVNIDAKTRSTLERNTKNLNKFSFVPAQECIYRLMDEDSFRRFCTLRRSKRSRLR